MTFQLGDYQAVELVGTGGSAEVFRGRRVTDGLPVALKVLPAAGLAALRREAALAAVVDHPHLPAVLDVLADASRSVLVTEFAEGGTLAELLDVRERLSAGETLTVLLPLAAVLATAHERQVVHGDLSAANVLFDRAGRPLLADLGAARTAVELGGPVQLTAQDAAPEVARGGPPSPAADLFALGSLGLACLTGRHAWPAEDLTDVLIQSTAGQWPDPDDDPAVPPGLTAAIRSLLDPVPERRPGAAALVIDLRAAGRPAPVLGLPPSRDHPSVGLPGRTRRAGTLPGPEAVGDTSDPGSADREARARAVTRIRPDAAPLPAPAVLGRVGPRWPGRPRWPVGRGGRPGSARTPRHRRPEAGGSSPHSGQRDRRGAAQQGRPVRRGLVGRALLALAAAGLLLLAVQGGLWWARWDRTPPAAAVETPVLPTPSMSALAHRSGAPAAVGAATGADGPAVVSTPALIPSAAATSTAPAGPGISVDWAGVVRRLDRARDQALVQRDPTLLDAVYTPGSTARAADAAVIEALRASGRTVGGAAHRLGAVTLIAGGATVRLSVTSSLPAYPLADRSGRVVGRTAAHGPATRLFVLTATTAGYRISDVRPADCCS